MSGAMSRAALRARSSPGSSPLRPTRVEGHDGTQSIVKERTVPRSLLMTTLALLLAGAPVPAAKAAAKIVVHPGDSLQAAIDAAPPGATIIVKPGIYQGPGGTRAITITQDGIHLVGAARRNQPVVLQQTGSQTHGIWVSPAD